jgi:hypothetical protein
LLDREKPRRTDYVYGVPYALNEGKMRREVPVLHLRHGAKIAAYVRVTGSGIVDRRERKHKMPFANHHVVEAATKTLNSSMLNLMAYGNDSRRMGPFDRTEYISFAYYRS